jgi:hypothetical protein
VLAKAATSRKPLRFIADSSSCCLPGVLIHSPRVARSVDGWDAGSHAFGDRCCAVEKSIGRVAAC